VERRRFELPVRFGPVRDQLLGEPRALESVENRGLHAVLKGREIRNRTTSSNLFRSSDEALRTAGPVQIFTGALNDLRAFTPACRFWSARMEGLTVIRTRAIAAVLALTCVARLCLRARMQSGRLPRSQERPRSRLQFHHGRRSGNAGRASRPAENRQSRSAHA
jgi:hypothetical protein